MAGYKINLPFKNCFLQEMIDGKEKKRDYYRTEKKKIYRRFIMEEKSVAIKDLRTLGVPKMLLLGLQHMFAMFGATILSLVNNYF